MSSSQESVLRKRLRPKAAASQSLSSQSQEGLDKKASESHKASSNLTEVTHQCALTLQATASDSDQGKAVRRHQKKGAAEGQNETGRSRKNITSPQNEMPQPKRATRQSASNQMTSSRASRVKKTQENDQLYMSSKELKQFQLAMKNSINETENVNATISEIEEMKTFYPSEQEFSDPLTYIDQLIKKQGAYQYGCIKIVPPQSFKPTLAFDQESPQKLPTRFQVLQELSQGKGFKQNATGRTFRELMDLSDQLETDQMETKEQFEYLEKRYWDMVENNVGPRTRVEYAADIPTGRFGSGFARKGQRGLSPSQQVIAEHPWNLNNLPKAYNSLMQFKRRQDISGINIPWLYIGMRYSTFCWHFEDLMLYSINFSHWGAPKQWYAIPESDREKFEKAVKQKVSLLFKKDPNILLDIVTMVSPAYLQQQGVKVYKTLQRPGEYILTLPGSYHSGFSTGLNIGEAVNFATRNWFEFGPKCQELYRRSREKIPVFPIEWIVTENIRNIEKINVDAASRAILQTKFNEYLNFEMRQRTFMESEMQTRMSVKDPAELPEGYEPVTLMKKRDEVLEDAHQCQYCTDFAYLSLINCSRCQINYCIWHNVHCGCNVPHVQIIYRFSTAELQALKAKAAAAVSKDRQQARKNNHSNSGKSSVQSK